MFAINQYNEGPHVPKLDGIILGRATTSEIVFFEQLGRALAVRGNTKEMYEQFNNYSKEELIEMCNSRDIFLKDDVTKEELIEKLIAPIIIDLTNNYDFIKELENNLGERIKEIQSKGLRNNNRPIKIIDASFDIEIENQDLFEMLRYVSDRLTKTWEDHYELAKTYYEYHGDLEVPQKFKTNDGYTYDENGIIPLGWWITTQRRKCLPESDRGKLLSKIGMRFENKKNIISWEEMYNYAKIYKKYHGNLEVLQKFKTNDGYTYDENGIIPLGQWIANQRGRCLPESDRGKLLSKIGMRFENRRPWEKMYNYAKIYKEYHGNLEVPQKFKTNDGYTYNENGKINLGQWIAVQRRNCLPESNRGKLLSKIGMIWSVKKNREEIINICEQYDIDINKNEIALNHISIQELLAKIEFLKSQNMPFTIEGKLHEIFSMSNLDIQQIYGISLEDIISNYYITPNERKN